MFSAQQKNLIMWCSSSPKVREKWRGRIVLIFTPAPKSFWLLSSFRHSFTISTVSYSYCHLQGSTMMRDTRCICHTKLIPQDWKVKWQMGLVLGKLQNNSCKLVWSYCERTCSVLTKTWVILYSLFDWALVVNQGLLCPNEIWMLIVLYLCALCVYVLSLSTGWPSSLWCCVRKSKTKHPPAGEKGTSVNMVRHAFILLPPQIHLHVFLLY